MIIPIILPDIKLNTLLDAANKAVGNVSRASDNTVRSQTIAEKYLSALSCLQGETKFTPSIRNPSIQKHLFFSFLIFADCETMSKSMELSGLAHSVFDTKKKRLQMAIISGTLAEFRDALLECSDNDELADLYDGIYLTFEAAGFREVFNFKKTPRTGGTFKLESR